MTLQNKLSFFYVLKLKDYIYVFLLLKKYKLFTLQI